MMEVLYTSKFCLNVQKKEKKRTKVKQKILIFFHNYFCPIFAELAYTMKVTEKSDVYSFGVVALEILMGRHPGELLTSLSSSQSVMLNEILDKRLPPPNRLVAQDVFLVSAI